MQEMLEEMMSVFKTPRTKTSAHLPYTYSKSKMKRVANNAVNRILKFEQF